MSDSKFSPSDKRLLHDAVKNGEFRTVSFLVSHLSQEERKTDESLFIATQFGYLSIVRMLVFEFGYSINEKLFTLAKDNNDSQILLFLKNVQIEEEKQSA